MADTIYKVYLHPGMFVRFRPLGKIKYKVTRYEQLIWDVDKGQKYMLYMPIRIGNNYYNLYNKLYNRCIEENYIFTILAFKDYGKVYTYTDIIKKEDLVNKYFLFVDQIFRMRVEEIIDSNVLGTDLRFIYIKLLVYYTKEELEVFTPDFVKDVFDKNRI